MEYFIYDYKNVNSNIEFTSYDRFLTNLQIYKYYLFDLSLLKLDPKIDESARYKSSNILNHQKTLFFLPYPITALTFIYLYKTNVFNSRIYLIEFKAVRRLLGLVIFTRLFQKALLKYEGDKILIDVAKNKNHTL
jgi:hypothetical protein